jgi:hypothetical protein
MASGEINLAEKSTSFFLITFIARARTLALDRPPRPSGSCLHSQECKICGFGSGL